MTSNPPNMKTLTEALIAAVDASGAMGAPAVAGVMPVVELKEFAGLPDDTLVRVLPIGPSSDLEGTRDRRFDQVALRVGVARPVKAGSMDAVYPLIDAVTVLREYLTVGPPPANPGDLTQPWGIGEAAVVSVEFAGGQGEAYVPEALLAFDVFLSELEVVLRHP